MAHNYFKIKTQYENLGDALINRELISWLKQGETLTVCTKNAPQQFIDNLNIDASNTVILKSVSDFYFKLTIHALFNRKKVNLFLNPGGYGGGVNIKKIISYVITTTTFALLYLCGVSIRRVGVSFSSLSSTNAILLKYQGKCLKTQAVRDSQSQKICSEAGIKTTHVIPDLAYSIASPLNTNTEHYEAIISFREPKSSTQLFRHLDQLVRLINGKILVAYQVEFDKEFQLIIAERYKKYDIEFKDLCHSLIENSRIYSQCRYVVSNRLHVLLLAMRYDVTPIAIVNNDENAKIVGIFKDGGIGDFLFDSNSPTTFLELPPPSNKVTELFENNRFELSTFFKEMNDG